MQKISKSIENVTEKEAEVDGHLRLRRLKGNGIIMKRMKRGFRLCAICLASACVLMGCNHNKDSSEPQQAIESSNAASETTTTTVPASKPVLTTTTATTTTTTATTTSTTAATTTIVTTTEAVTTTTVSSATGNQTEITTQATTLTTATASSDAGNVRSKYLGIWNCTTVVLDGVEYPLADLEAQLGMPLFFRITVSADGTLSVRSSVSAEAETGIWSEENGNAVFTVDGQSITANLLNDQLVLTEMENQMYFVKAT